MPLKTIEECIAEVLADPKAYEIAAELDRLLAEEHQRRLLFYSETDEGIKTEFINGEIVVHPPDIHAHSETVGALFKLLLTFANVAKLGFVGALRVMTSFTRNDYEPDVVYFNRDKSQHFKIGHWQYPVPDFVVEVLSESAKSYDRGVKFIDYEAHKVNEYWIIDPLEQTIEQYLLTDGRFQLHLKSGHGMIESRAVEGFTIDIRAVFDDQVNIATARKMLSV